MKNRNRNQRVKKASSWTGRRLQVAGFTLRQVAAKAKVSERMLHYHLRYEKYSPAVARVIDRLLKTKSAA